MAKKKVKTNLYFVADRSGSMNHMASEVIGGFNAYVEKQKAEPGEANLTLVQFDSEYEVVHKALPIKEVPELTSKVYFARGMTALYDAVGKTITEGLISSNAGELNIITIMTDGAENASKEYSYEAVKALIKRAQDEFNWEVIFLGANMNAREYATNMGIKAKNVSNFAANGAGMLNAVNTMSFASSSYRGFASGTVMDANMEAFVKAADVSTALSDAYDKIDKDSKTKV